MEEFKKLKLENFRLYLKTIISIEMGIKEDWILERMALKYIEDNEMSTILNEKFENYLEEIINGN